MRKSVRKPIFLKIISRTGIKKIKLIGLFANENTVKETILSLTIHILLMNNISSLDNVTSSGDIYLQASNLIRSGQSLLVKSYGV